MSNPFSTGGYVDQAQKKAQIGAQGLADTAERPLSQQIGTMLGGLNSTGALRSGQANVAAGDIASAYGKEVGGYAKQAAGEAMGAGLAANEQDTMRQQMAAQRKASLLSGIGSALGFGASMLL